MTKLLTVPRDRVPLRFGRGCRRTLALLGFAWCLAGFPAVSAKGADEPAANPPEPAEIAGGADQALDDAREAEKQRKAMAGLLALCGILIGGLMFVVVVMIWGARLRRMARRELPAQKTLQNELWFLKPPKSPPE